MTYTPLNIEVYRKRKNITQSELADLIGKTQAQISHLENSRAVTDQDTLKAIGEVLDVDPEDLLKPFVPDLVQQL